jgi:hypothetical protein
VHHPAEAEDGFPFTALTLVGSVTAFDNRRMSKAQHSIADTEDSAFLTTGEFAQRVHLSTTTVKKACDAGLLAHVVVTSRGDRRIPVSEVYRLLAEADANRLNVTARPDRHREVGSGISDRSGTVERTTGRLLKPSFAVQ